MYIWKIDTKIEEKFFVFLINAYELFVLNSLY